MNRSLTLKNKQQLVLNSELELGESEGKGKGRFFTSRFLEPGIAHYEELGDILITKETLNKFVHTMVGAPVIIDHEDVTDKNVDKLRVGVISRVWFNEFDGWFYCEGILTDNEAIDLIKNQGWNVSCAYSFESVPKEMHNGKKIDMEFIDGEFLHLAIVKNPRYEGANIVVNKNDDDLQWITVKGNHIPVKKGQSKDEAVKEFLEGKKETGSKDYNTGDKITFDTNWRGVNEKISEGTIIGKEKKLGTKDDPNPDYQYKVKTSDGKTILVEKEAIKDTKDKSGDDTKHKQKPDINKYNFKNFKNPDAFLQGHMKQCETYKDTFDYVLKETDKKFENVKKTYWGNTPPEKQFRIELQNINTHNAVRDLMDSWANRNKDYKPLIDDIKAYQQDLLSQLSGYNKWNGKEWIKEKANNSIGDITMTVLNDLTDFIKKVVKNEKDEEMKEVKNEDKRKLIDEIGGILKDKVDDEIIRTVIKKAEELSYEPSEDDKADNKAKNEDEKEAKNKCKNEEDKEEEIEEKVTENEDEEEDKKEDKAENKKVKNSMKDIVMGGSSQAQTQKLYTSRKERLEEGNKY